MLLGAFSWAVALAALAQSNEPLPEFEAASVKVSTVRNEIPALGGFEFFERTMRISGGPGTADPGRIMCLRCPLRPIVSTAYEVGPYQVRAPDWAYLPRYDIIAKVPPGSTRHQVSLMLRQLLAERFQLTMHWEKTSVPVYALVIGKQGSKLQPTQHAESDPDAPIENTPAIHGGQCAPNLYTPTGQNKSVNSFSKYINSTSDALRIASRN
jgi:uncharacterized protein (TIGR03435 family)